MSRWYAAKKELPKHENSVIVTDGEECFIAYYDHEYEKWMGVGIFDEDVTYWTFLPRLPHEDD